jgi:phage FluMu gp28-like protein
MRKERRFVVPLAEAAHRLGWTWAQAFTAVLTQRLAGKRLGARWYVAEDDLERLVRARGEEFP